MNMSTATNTSERPSILKNYNDFSNALYPQSGWRELFPKEHEKLMIPFSNPDLNNFEITTVLLNHNTKQVDVDNAIRLKNNQVQHGQQIMLVQHKNSDNNAHYVVSDNKKRKMQGPEIPTSIWFKSNHSNQIIKIEIYWCNITSCSNKTFIHNKPQNASQESITSLLLPSNGTICEGDDAWTIANLIKNYNTQEKVSTYRTPTKIYNFKDITALFNKCNLVLSTDDHLQECTTHFFGTRHPTASNTSHANKEDPMHIKIIGKFLLYERIWKLATTYLTAQACPIPAIACFATKLKAEDIQDLLSTCLDESISKQIVTFSDGQNKLIHPDDHHNTIVGKTPKLDKDFQTSILDAYFQTVRLTCYIEGEINQYYEKSVIDKIKLKKQLIRDLGHRHDNDNRILKRDLSLPQPKSRIENYNSFASYYADNMMEKHIPVGLTLLDATIENPFEINELLRNRKNFFSRHMKEKLLYYFHTAFPQATLPQELHLLQRDENLLNFAFNIHQTPHKDQPYDDDTTNEI